MIWEDAESALISHFATAWGVLGYTSTVPIDYPNAPKVSPTGPWGRLLIAGTDSRRRTLGGDSYVASVRGLIWMRLFVPLGEGTGSLATYVNDAKGVWLSAHADGLSGDIHLGHPIPGLNGKDPDAPYWGDGFSVPFHFDEIVS